MIVERIILQKLAATPPRVFVKRVAEIAEIENRTVVKSAAIILDPIQGDTDANPLQGNYLINSSAI